MTEPEMKAFLSDNKTLRLATLGSDGGPRIVPLAFMYEDMKFYIITAAKTRKVRNIKTHNKVAFAVDLEFRAVVGKGTARVLPPGSLHDEIRKKLITHLVGSLENPFAKVMMSPDRLIMEITPTTMRSWKNALAIYMA